MAALSDTGAFFASEAVPGRTLAEGEAAVGGEGSTLYYHSLPAGQSELGGASESFTLTLDDGEAAVAVVSEWKRLMHIFILIYMLYI
jgi:hypothetical protein